MSVAHIPRIHITLANITSKDIKTRQKRAIGNSRQCCHCFTLSSSQQILIQFKMSQTLHLNQLTILSINILHYASICHFSVTKEDKQEESYIRSSPSWFSRNYFLYHCSDITHGWRTCPAMDLHISVTKYRSICAIAAIGVDADMKFVTTDQLTILVSTHFPVLYQSQCLTKCYMAIYESKISSILLLQQYLFRLYNSLLCVLWLINNCVFCIMFCGSFSRTWRVLRRPIWWR